MSICWLAGCSHHHIRVIAGVSVRFFYATVHKVLRAINNCEQLQLKFPTTKEDMQHIALGFKKISNDGIITGCIDCIDGWLCPINVPKKNEVGRVTAFYSGHYAQYGINVQACCDYISQFTAFSVMNPGGTGDALAYQRWKLSSALEAIDGPYFVAGDNAYVQAKHLMTPFNKLELQLNPQARDIYNFHLSQLRIDVEMVFGLLVNKWGILKRNLQVSFILLLM